MSVWLNINHLVIAGSVLRCDVTGKVLMKCFLSGMPDLKLGLNDKIGLEKESQLKSRPTKRWFQIAFTSHPMLLRFVHISSSCFLSFQCCSFCDGIFMVILPLL